MADSPQCSGAIDAWDPAFGSLGLRVGALFIIMASSGFMTLFPIVTKRSRINFPAGIFDFCKFFGSGVIIATAFIHLLAPAASDEELGSPCLSESFQNYDFAFAFAMISSFATFIVELVAFRVGAGLAKSLAYDPHMGGHHHAAEHGNPPRAASIVQQHDGSLAGASDDADVGPGKKEVGGQIPSDLEAMSQLDKTEEGNLSAAASQILGVGVLEFGVIFHSVIIGITLSTTQDEFKILFIVIIFHQMFEGLGLGTRLALLPLKPGSKIPYIGALAYAVVTPIGMAIGLGVRNTYNGDSATAAYVTGIFDAFSAGILLYTGFVELLAHEFIFNEKMRTAPLGKVMLNVVEMLAGAGLMALLGRWA